MTGSHAVVKSLREPVVFHTLLEKNLEKHRKRTKPFLKIAGFSTALVIVFSIILGILNRNVDSLSQAYRGFITLITIVGLGIYTWPFWLYNLLKRNSANKSVSAMPPPGESRFEYAIRWYEKRHWVRQPVEENASHTMSMQKKKRFNIFLGLFFMLFGLIGFLIYINELKKPGSTMDLTLTEDGLVKVR